MKPAATINIDIYIFLSKNIRLKESGFMYFNKCDNTIGIMRINPLYFVAAAKPAVNPGKYVFIRVSSH